MGKYKIYLAPPLLNYDCTTDTRIAWQNGIRTITILLIVFHLFIYYFGDSKPTWIPSLTCYCKSYQGLTVMMPFVVIVVRRGRSKQRAELKELGYFLSLASSCFWHVVPFFYYCKSWVKKPTVGKRAGNRGGGDWKGLLDMQEHWQYYLKHLHAFNESNHQEDPPFFFLPYP